jgi:hypothetical protein
MKHRIAKLAIAGSVFAGGIFSSTTGAMAAPPPGQCEVTSLGNTVGTAECTGVARIARIYADCEFQKDPDFVNEFIPAGRGVQYQFECNTKIRGIFFTFNP